jgi:hypothetical protein
MWLAVGVQSAKGTAAYRFAYLQPVDVGGFFKEFAEIESNKRIGTRFKGSNYVGMQTVPFNFSVEFNPGDCGMLLYGALGAEAGAVSGDGYTHTMTAAEDLPYLTFLLYSAGIADDSGTVKVHRITDAKIGKMTITGNIDEVAMLNIEGTGIDSGAIEDVATSFTADITNADATLTDISETDGIYAGMPISGTGIPAGTVIASFDTGLTGAMALANALKDTIVGHINDFGGGGEEHKAQDPAGATLAAVADATTLATLLTLTNALTTCYDTHDEDIDDATPTYHQAQSSVNDLTSTANVTTLHGAIDQLNDIKAKYNLHDQDTTGHTTGSDHQESTADADTTAEMSADATATNTDETVTVSSFSTAASAGFTSDTPFFVKSSLCTGLVSIGATLGAVATYSECRALNLDIENGLSPDNRIDNTSTPFAIEEGESEITGMIDCIYNAESIAEIEYFQSNTARALKIVLTTTNVFDTDNYKTLTINVYQAKYTGGGPNWDPDVINVELPYKVDVAEGFDIILFDNTGTEYDDSGTAIT